MNGTMRFAQFEFSREDGRLSNTTNGEAVVLRPRVAKLLELLLDADGAVVDRETLFRDVWGEGAVVDFEAGLAALVSELRKALVQVGAQAGFVETIPRRGYRIRQRSKQRSTRWLVIAATAVVVLLVTAILWMPTKEPMAPMDVEPTMALAILPFERYGDLEREPVHADLLIPDALLARFWRDGFAGLELVGRASLRPYEGRTDIAAAVAEDLGVNLLVEGSIIANTEGWQVTARLLQIPGGRVLWSHTVDWLGEGPLPISDVADNLISDFQVHFSEILVVLDGIGRDRSPE